jgi:hypothetical protein
MRSLLLLATLSLALGSFTASAVISTQSNLSDWNTAVTAIPGYDSTSFDDFGTTTLPKGAYNSTAIPGLTIDPDWPDAQVRTAQGGGVAYAFDEGHWFDQVNTAGNITEITYTQPMVGLGGDWSMFPRLPNDGVFLDIEYVGGGTATVGQVPGASDGAFYGFASTMPFSKVIIRHVNGGPTGNPQETYALDDLYVAAIPEPSTIIALIALGFIGLTQRRHIVRFFSREK